MATYNFLPGSSLGGFNPALDVLAFGPGLAAGSLVFAQSGNNLSVSVGGQPMTLLSVLYTQLRSSSLAFADGSLFVPGTVGSDTLAGSALADYFDLGLGGSDSVTAGQGNDVLVIGAALDAGDRIDGGTGQDTLQLSGDYGAPVALAPDTVTGVEQFRIGAGNVRLTLTGTGVFSGVSSALNFDASAQLAGSLFQFDASGLGVPVISPSYGNLQVTGGAGNDALFTGAGNDNVSGGAGDDVLRGGGGGDWLYGQAGNDNLAGEDGADQLNGGDGNDTLDGGAGNDTLNGGTGNDVLLGGDGDDSLAGGMDADVLTGGAGNDRFRFDFGSPRSESSQTTLDTITDFAVGDLLDLPGTNYINNLPLVFVAGETLFRTDAQPFSAGDLGVRPGSNPGDGFVDVMWRYSAALNRVELWVDGNDDGQFSEVDTFVLLDSSLTGRTTLSAADFVDNFVAWRGTDGGDVFGAGTPGINLGADNLAYALGGNDNLDGGAGADRLYGGVGNDSLNGDDGNDTLYGGSGADELFGGAGSDTLYAAGNDAPNTPGSDAPGTVNLLDGGAGNDNLYGDAGDDTLLGGADNDNLYGYAGNDTLSGGDGNDTLDGGAGSDSLDGGAGADTLRSSASSGVPRGTHTDTLSGGEGNDVLELYYGSSNGGSSSADRNVATGGAGADQFALEYGSRDFTWSSSGYLYSPVSSPDRLTDFNGAEGDVLVSGIGNGLGGNFGNIPLVWRGAAAPGFTAALGQSLALASSSGSVETRFLELWTAYDAVGDRTRLFMDRNRDGSVDGNDFLLELDGNPVLGPSSFSAGTFTVKVGTDGDDTDTSPALTGGDDIAYGLGGNDSLDGLGGNDDLAGDAGDDQLTGGAGNDDLYGGAGADTLYGGTGGDVLYGGAGADSLYGGDDADTLYAAGRTDPTNTSASDAAGTVNVLDGGAGNDNLYGDGGDDTLLGGADNDDLSGYAGNDTLSGGDGNDTLDGGTGSDSLDGGAGVDTLRSSTSSGVPRGTHTDTLGGGEGNDVFELYYASSGGSSTADRNVATGGSGADQFRLHWSSLNFTWSSSPYLYSPVSSPDRLTDFNGAEGDVLVSGIGNGLGGQSANIPLVWRGAAAPGFTAALGQSAPGSDLGLDVLQVFSFYDAARNQTGLFMDRNRDGSVDANDFLLMFDGNRALDATAFSAGTFIAAGGVGSGGNDSLVGTAGNDVLVGGAGADTLSGLAGNDRIQGDAGDDSLDGGDGNDTLQGNAGNDTLLGGANDDALDGGLGDDTLYGGAGNDSLYAAQSVSDAASAQNWLHGGDGNDNLYGAGGSDWLYGDAGVDTLYGRDGMDLLDGGAGADNLYGEGGDDRLVYDPTDANLDGGSGLDLLVLQVGASYAGINLGNASDQTSGDAAVMRAMEGVDFSALAAAVVFAGSANADWLIGTAFADSLSGLGGNDTLDGGVGADTLTGGTGNDVYVVDDVGDVVVELVNEGTDEVRASITHALAANVEILRLTGSADIDGSGNALANTFSGNAGRNVLAGGAGNDVYLIDDPSDTVLEAAGEGTDEVRSSIDHVLAAEVENLTLLGTVGLRGTGNGLANVLVGTTGNDELYGLDGNDTLQGGNGNDLLDGGAGNDVLQGGAGDDQYVVDAAGDTITESSGIDTVFAGINYTLGSGLENLTLTGSAGLTGTGNSGANVITGNAAANTLSGLAGVDILTGGAGIDLFRDTAANLNGDTITDLAPEDFIEITGRRFSSADYDLDTGLLRLDTDANGSFETQLQLASGLSGVFRVQASTTQEAAYTRLWNVPDTDRDGYPDDVDNAVLMPNPDQRDSDGDGFGNIADADLDQSGLIDGSDLDIFESLFGSTDANADFNGDGGVDLFDLSLLDGMFGGPPGPSAGGGGLGGSSLELAGAAAGEPLTTDPWTPDYQPSMGEFLL
jgi:Ca2+-binding RTX toxin-like protein